MWSLYKNNQFLKPLLFSNGKTQEDIVKEVLEAIAQGHKIIFIKGKCGTGKSAIALNLARQLGKTSIVVPIKSLQEQYIKDYTDDLYILDKQNKNKLKISSIVGRQNFKCKFIEENKIPEKHLIKEKDSVLTDIFSRVIGTRDLKKERKKDASCDNEALPCKIEIKDKNVEIIKDYIRQNPSVKSSDFFSVSEVKRMTIAPVCPYWSPILPLEYDVNFKNSKKFFYKGLDEQNFVIHQRKPGCLYYEQYEAYSKADIIIFNSLKYKLETVMNRKPLTELEIIDECDEFLDSFSNQERININRLLLSLSVLFSENKTSRQIIDELIEITNSIKRNYNTSEEIFDTEQKQTAPFKVQSVSNETGFSSVSPNPRQTNDFNRWYKSEGFGDVKNSLIEELIESVIVNKELLREIEIDENNYLFHLEKIAKMFYDFIDEAFFSVEKKDEELIINLVTINLKKRFQELMEKNKILVLMSGTIHSEHVLKNIFGLEKYKVIEAETKHQGEFIKCKHGYEIDCKFSNFRSEKITREKYLKTFSKTIASAKKPILIHLTSFSDLPTEKEKQNYNLENLPTQNEIMKEQDEDPLGNRVKNFKDKKTDILFTTKCSRGIDFPGDTCNSIIISRFPYPNISSLFWKIFKKTNPEYFMSFYIDKANRELLQRIYRGLRSKNDKVYLLSPDVRVLKYNF